METLSFVVPGLFGHRMDTLGGGNYWGAVGRDPAWDRFFASGAQGTPPSGSIRFSGGGSYAGVFVMLVAAWALVQSVRKEQSVFALAHRRAIWFWFAVGFVALLLSFGRFAPFYQFIYALPYFSIMRNPAKFTHFVDLSIVILFAYGVHGLSRRYLETPLLAKGGMVACLRAWWGRVQGFDRRWTAVCLLGRSVERARLADLRGVTRPSGSVPAKGAIRRCPGQGHRRVQHRAGRVVCAFARRGCRVAVPGL